MARVLVTGSAGLIGSHLVDYLIETGNTVSGVDNLSTCPISNVSSKAREKFYQADLRQKGTAELVVKMTRPQILFHCAAWAHEGLGQFSPRLITENNINIFLNTLIPAIRAGVKRVVFFSSVAVYGEQEPPYTEETPRQSVDIYGANKVFIEDALKVLAKVHNFEYTIIRAYNVFGERQSLTDPYRGVVAIFTNNVMHGRPIYIYGDGEQKRSLTYIRDIIPTIADCGFDPKAANEVFNIGDNRVYSINDLVRAIEKASGKKIEPTYLPDRVAEVKVAYCDNSKAKRVLGLKIDSNFNDAIKNVWEWAVTLGPQESKHLNYFELPSDKIPANWIKQK